MSKFLFFLNILAVIVLLWAYMAPFISPSISEFFALFGLFFPFIVLVNIAFVIFWLLAKPKFAILGILSLVMGYGPMNRFFSLNTSIEDEESGFEVLSYNLGGNQLLSPRDGKEKAERIDQFEDFVAHVKDVEVLCFQELGLKTREKVQHLFKDYHSAETEYRGTKVYSKYPIVDAGNIKLESLSHNAAWVDLLIKNDTIRIYSIHLSSNRVSGTTDQMLEEPNLNEDEFWDDFKGILKKYTHHAKLRSAQLFEVLKHAESSKYPTIICGDFNDVPQSFIYRSMARNYSDSFTESGLGFGHTYRNKLLALRIDYIFADSNFEFRKHKKLNYKFSDHYPILSSIRLAN